MPKIKFKGGKDYLNERSFMRVDDVAQELGVSRSYAYKLI